MHNLPPRPVEAEPPPTTPSTGPETHYLYRDEERRPLFRVVRTGDAADTHWRQERPDPARPGHWLPGRADVRGVLYRLPELLAAPLATPIFIVESEPCVHALLAHGHIATCPPGGAGQWRDAYSTALLNRRVIVLPDNDEPGRAHAGQVAASVATVAADVRLVRPLDLPAGGDIEDWYQAGHHDQELQALIAMTLPWVWPEPEPAPPSPWIGSPVPDYAAHLVRRAALPDEQRAERMAHAIADALLARGLPAATVHQLLLATAAELDDPSPAWQSAAVSAARARQWAGGSGAGTEELERLVGAMPAAVLTDLAAHDVALGEAWPEPIPLGAVEPVPFPLDALPDWLGRYVRGLAVETQTPPDLTAMLALAVLALAAARRARLRIRPHWVEPLCLYVLVALRTGARKSSVFRAVSEPVRRYEQAYNQAHVLQIQQGQARRRLLEQRLRRAEREAATAAAGGEERVLALVAELDALEATTTLSLIEGDCTPEALIAALAEQGGSLAMLAPEGGLLSTVTGMQYGESNVAHLDALLAAHAGDAIKLRRVGRGPHAIPEPALTIGLTLQPTVLARLAGRSDFRARGLLARFLYSAPCDLLGTRDADPPVMDAAVSDEYARRIQALLALPSARDGHGVPTRYELTLDGAAHAALTAFMRWIEPRLAEDGALAGDDGWARKLAGHTARLAALLHLATGDPECALATPVAAPAMERAIRLSREYLIPQARAALGAMGADPTLEEARHVLAWITRHQQTRFTRRDVWSDLRARFAQPRAADPALRLLCDLGCIRPVAPEEHRRGRRPDAAYTVNPRVLRRPTQNTRNGGHSAYSAYSA